MDIENFTSIMAGYAERAAETIKTLAVQHGPDAIDLALLYVRVDIGANILWAFMWAIVAFVGYKIFTHYHNVFKEWLLKVGRPWTDDGDTIIPTLFFIATRGICVFLIVMNTMAMLGPWKLIGLYKPELYLIHKAINKMTEETSAKSSKKS